MQGRLLSLLRNSLVQVAKQQTRQTSYPNQSYLYHNNRRHSSSTLQFFRNYSHTTNSDSSVPLARPKPDPATPTNTFISPLPLRNKAEQEDKATSKTAIMVDKVMKHYILPLDQPVVSLDCSEAFEGLSQKEKLYSHYLSQGAWIGGLVVLVQTSPESPVIFSLLHDLFKSNGVEGLRSVAIGECNFTEDEWKALTVYTSGIFASMGNYKGFGDTKFIPGVPCDKLSVLLNKAKFLGMGGKDIEAKWEYVKDKMYTLGDREKQLGLGQKGVTTYFSANCSKEDSELVQRFLKKEKLEAWNTRCFKMVDGASPLYEIRSASSELDEGPPKIFEFEGANIRLTKGDYAPLMALTAEYLEKAKEFASNDTEKSMLECYAKSFQGGKVDMHKEGSRFWIKDKGPVIETYIGFIETYRDPTGVRAEFEGFVAVVNRETSKKFGKLVDHASEFLKLLPWPKEFERETFMKPDFTSLDVLSFAGSGIPAGINIPNYDEIRQNEGFKNVSLGNVIPASYKDSVIPFLSAADKEMLEKYRVPSFSVQVALHELLGHGSGKLLKKNDDGTLNYSPDLKNPLTGQLIERCYDHNDTYDSIFGDMGSAFEECRAECVGILLSLDKTILKLVFGYEGEEADDIIYINWLSMIYAGGAKALEMYQPDTSQWMQAHSQARFSILRVLVEAGEGLVHVEETVGSDGKPDLLITLDRSKIDTVGRKAISDYLLKIQVYKATADIESAREMFGKLTAVNNEGKYPWASWREIVMDKKQPRKFFVQHNTVAEGETVSLKNYETTPEGMIQSWIERFPDSKAVYKALDYNWLKDKHHF